ncbi:hypothetical protein SPRG_20669 [Saprolegnia parasitica CBS 223.65]|uniref:Uncharacterized protein n=1 Tax=Saprolegnia parasitica (strain CBS 223.65) TaxID=695850 RepID=A0A067C8Q6_SAPPC|nr:hypothetical protein SPRG_20669 [Saprolegnia parasitica CBS 223.65]KDO25550.1 hypothetical protein SPRG_20669 [Saprolegnia parasitica CBS 223.65]|eukprot:XP_012203773.1 hypothetical protein SPRG_20669 [Saprolegnia parasitica CBS 223.65]
MLDDADLVRGAGLLVMAFGALLLVTIAPLWFVSSAVEASGAHVSARYGLLELCTTALYPNASTTNTCYRLHAALLPPSSHRVYAPGSVCASFGANASAATTVMAQITGLGTHDTARYLTWECDSPHLLSVLALLALLALTLVGLVWVVAIAAMHQPLGAHASFSTLWLLLSICYGWVFAELFARAVWRRLIVGGLDHLSYGMGLLYLLVAYALHAHGLPVLALYQNRLQTRLDLGLICA